MPLFSVVIPAYNRVALIAQTLDSVLQQAYRDFEVLVVDDGSTDGTQEAVGRYGDAVRLLSQTNQGPGAARNFGMRHAAGEYLAFLDSDDVWFPWTLATYAAIIHQSRPALIAGRLAHFTDANELQSIEQAPLEADSYADYLTASRRGLYCGSGQLVVRRDLALQAGGFAEDRVNSEDHDFVLRLGTAPGYVDVRAPVLIGYRTHPQSLVHDLSKVFHGGQYLLQRERADCYPGGDARRDERRRILTQHLRMIALRLLKSGRRQDAWRLYKDTFAWHVAQGRLRFLAGFLALACLRWR